MFLRGGCTLTVTSSSCCSSDPEIICGTSTQNSSEIMNESLILIRFKPLAPPLWSQSERLVWVYFFLASASLNSWLYGWVNSSTALQAVPALPSLVSKVPLRDWPSQICLNSNKQAPTGSNVLPAGNMATLSWVSQTLYFSAVDVDLVFPVKGLILVMSRLWWRKVTLDFKP